MVSVCEREFLGVSLFQLLVLILFFLFRAKREKNIRGHL